MIPVKYIDPDDLPLYAMQSLPPEEMAEMTESLRHSLDGRRELAETYGDLALLAGSAEQVEAPASARARFLAQVQRERKVIPMLEKPPVAAPVAEVVAIDRPRRSQAGHVIGWLGWAAAAALAFEAGNLWTQRESLRDQVTSARVQADDAGHSAESANAALDAMRDPQAEHVMLTSTGTKPPPQGRVNYVAAKGTLVLLANNLEPVAPGKTYELWIIPADGTAPIPAGTFTPDPRGNASVVLPEIPKGVHAKAFGVTLENAGGATSPTMPILLQGAAG